jgi:hypothetical protein
MRGFSPFGSRLTLIFSAKIFDVTREALQLWKEDERPASNR